MTVDHKNRIKLDNTRENLRWVSKSFNAWNSVSVGGNTSTSRFRGVSKKVRSGPEWHACGLNGAHIGHFHTEREAAIATATVYVRAYGDWAATSDLLVSEDQTLSDALLSLEEMRKIVQSITAVDALTHLPIKPTKGTGVALTKNNRFVVSFRGKYLKTFTTLDAALVFRKQYVGAVLEQEWQTHLLTDPTKDSDGDVVICLTSGKYGVGLTAKVDLQYWHNLTYKRSWSSSAEGYPRSGCGMLHTAVMLLIDPTYEASRDTSIDHIDPDSKLDNRACNLRVATNLEQQRNKVRRKGTASSHLGVYRDRKSWAGSFSYTTNEGSLRYRVCADTEDKVTALLKVKRIEIYGDKAVLGP